MSYAKAPFATRLSRSLRLLRSLWSTATQMRRIQPDDLNERNRLLQTAGRRMLAALDIEVITESPTQPTPHPTGYLIVANHISWLDIFALTAYYPGSFIAMKEILSWPLLGTIVRNAGTVFIDRKNKKDIDPINNAITQSLQSGQNIIFFPEAKTSGGESVLPFKAALFQSAINTQTLIQPVALRYYDEAGQRTTLPSFADVNLFVSFWRVISMRKIRIHLDSAAPIDPKQHQEANRFLLKDLAESEIRKQVMQDSPTPQETDASA